MGIGLHLLGIAMRGPAAIGIRQKEPREPVRKLRRHLSQVHVPPAAGGKLHLDCVAMVMLKLLQGLNQQIVHGKPDRPPPIRIAAKHPTARFGRLIVHPVYVTVNRQLVRMFLVILRKRANAIRREKLPGIEHPLHQLPQPFATHQRQQPTFADALPGERCQISR